MHGHIAHFAINADDLPATVGFYSSVFGWSFDEAYPGFFRSTSAGEAIAAVQARRALLAVPTNGFECTFAVDDVGVAVAAALAGGGTVLMEPATIDGVGELAFLSDPSGSVVGVMRFL